MKAELIPADGGEPIPITKDVTVLGRREYCDIQIDHPSLSKRHCVIVKTEGLLVIRDLATTNGTKVKGQKIRWAALLPDDRIALGSIKFRVFLGPDAAAESPPQVVAASRARSKFSAPPAYASANDPVPVPAPSMPSPSPSPAQRKPKAPAPPAPVAHPAIDEGDDFVLPLVLDDGAWRDALGPDSGEIPDIIDLD